jgi:hypothetical protein
MSHTRHTQVSWLVLLDGCLRDRMRFRRLLTLVLVLAAFALAVIAVAGWPVAGVGAVTAWMLGGRGRRVESAAEPRKAARPGTRRRQEEQRGAALRSDDDRGLAGDAMGVARNRFVGSASFPAG